MYAKYIVFSKNVKTLLTGNNLTGNNFDTVIVHEVLNRRINDPVDLLERIRGFLTGFDTVVYDEDQDKDTYELHCARVLLSIKQIADSVLKLKK